MSCRREGHDWQPTEAAGIHLCGRCDTERVTTATSWIYRYRNGYVNRNRNRPTIANRARVHGAVPSTFRFVVDGATYLALKHRHGRNVYWHVYEAQIDAAGRGRRRAHILAVRTLAQVPGAIAAWQASSIEDDEESA